jgi:prepilin-type N-terminal cleavage/methylation domain-containing protein
MNGADSSRHGNDDGFSLIEALVALAIIAAMTGALVETLAADAHARLAVQQRRMALLVAQSALDRARGGEAVNTGHSDGPGPALQWHIDRQPYQESAVPFAATRLEQLTVTVADPGGHRLVRIATVRIVQ